MPNAVWILSLAQALAMCTAPFIVFIGSLIGRDLAPNSAWATLPVGLVVVGTVLSVGRVTQLMARFGRKVVMVSGALTGAASALCGALAVQLGSFTLLCLAALGGGIGLAVVQQYRFAAMELVPQELTGTAAARVLLGGLGAAWLGPEIAAVGRNVSGAPFMMSWLYLAGVQLLAAGILWQFYHPKPWTGAASTSIGGRSLTVLARQPVLWAAVGSASIGYGVMSFIMTATPLSMTEHAGHSLTEAKWVIQAHIVAMYLPSLISGWLIRRLGLGKMLFVGVAAFAAALGLALAGQQLHHFGAALLLLGVGWNFLFVGGTTLLPQAYREEERFRVQGLNERFVFGSQATAALSAGAALNVLGWQGLLWVVVPILLLHLGLLLAWRVSARTPASATPE